MKTGRNDPCPCGSGKKYKHCCLSQTDSVSNELSDLLASQDFNSIEETQVATQTFMEAKNHQPPAAR